MGDLCAGALWPHKVVVVALLVVLWLSLAQAVTTVAETPKQEFTKGKNGGKICIGTNGRMSVPSNRDHHYRNLRDRYINCTYVDGNLELTWLQDENLDLSFLHNIREVTGYVLISHVDVKRIVLPSLQIIRGRTLFELNTYTNSFALFVTLSKMHTLEMPALRDILKGNVGFFNNYNLCHIQTIDWHEIRSDNVPQPIYVYNFTQPARTCDCHESCEKGCWGEGADNCQKFSKVTCAKQCSLGRCYGRGPRECCHLFCAGGCTGPTQSDCLACKNFYDDGECKQECPPMMRYNTITYSWETNPNGKYAYGATCVKNCPEHLLRDNGACVRSCPPNKKAVNGECVHCNGPCPKTCPGAGNVHAGNIESFRFCTVIQGSLTILDHSFDGFQEVFQNFTFGPRYPKMHPSALDVFNTLTEVTGFINIQASHPEFTDLSFLKNLEVIGGRDLTEYFSSLYIVKTSLRSLNLKKLRRIRSGKVYILENNDLCFVDNIKWKKLIRGDDVKSQILLQNNRDQNLCLSDNEVCHPECSDDGCWGKGQEECLSCRNLKLDETCVKSCNNVGIYKKDSKMCGRCDPQCNGGCHGPDANHCVRCKSVTDGPYCVADCPSTKYNNNGTCQLCHENCVDGCNGPDNTISNNGCKSCQKAVVTSDMNVEYCLKEKDFCPEGFFSEWVSLHETGHMKVLAGNSICRKCHPRCKNCTAYGFHSSVCHECKNYRRGEQCEDECPQDHYADDVAHECKKCNTECSSTHGCRGPVESDCNQCRSFRIFLSGGPGPDNTHFTCAATCPKEQPYKLFPEDKSDPYCGVDLLNLDEESIPAILGGTLGCVFLLCIFLAVFCYLWWQRNKTKEAALKMTMTMMPYDDAEPLKPTNIKPNLAKLRIVKEAELRRGGILGYGAFGTVYKGVWVPEGENVKIPVAIKVLREGTGTNISKEILEEAYIMASVDHPNLLQLLAVCMTTQIMLITQLMPLGCLLDYVRNNKEKVGSKPLLNWCTQIARGMAYLEEKGIVHRDLAARNVLVQTPNCVKITDFGLAKLLEHNEEEYKAAGGKMPIKWLALECIQHRIFTHKSDVWAFGVTVWEILTYGGRPYEDIPAREVPDLLEKGERLPQPPICTIDVYMLMIRCWMLDAESRPSHKELAEHLAKMARDPGRFLVIPGDKLMRLPSYTPNDEKELINSLSSAIEGEGVVMAAEEYLQPKYGNLSAFTSSGTITTSTSDPETPIKKAFSGHNIDTLNGGFHYGTTGRRREFSENRHNSQREKKYAHLDNCGTLNGSLKRQREDTRSLRYTQDPLKNLNLDMADDSGAPNQSSVVGSSGPSYGWVGDLRLDLPLDEDDYLMPQQTQGGLPSLGPTHHPYATTVREASHKQLYGNYQRGQNGHLPRAVSNGSLLPGTAGPESSGNQWGAMDNPEYHIMNQRTHSPPMYGNRSAPPQQTIGVPVLDQPGCRNGYASGNSNSGPNSSSYGMSGPSSNVISGSNSGPSSVTSNGHSNGHITPQQLPMPSPLEASHEYYNDIGRISNGTLKKKKGETCV